MPGDARVAVSFVVNFEEGAEFSIADGDDHTDEERKLINETRKILADPAIRVSATCVRVPVLNGHSEAVNVQTREPLGPERARELYGIPDNVKPFTCVAIGYVGDPSASPHR